MLAKSPWNYHLMFICIKLAKKYEAFSKCYFEKVFNVFTKILTCSNLIFYRNRVKKECNYEPCLNVARSNISAWLLFAMLHLKKKNARSVWNNKFGEGVSIKILLFLMKKGVWNLKKQNKTCQFCNNIIPIRQCMIAELY